MIARQAKRRCVLRCCKVIMSRPTIASDAHPSVHSAGTGFFMKLFMPSRLPWSTNFLVGAAGDRRKPTFCQFWEPSSGMQQVEAAHFGHVVVRNDQMHPAGFDHSKSGRSIRGRGNGANAHCVRSAWVMRPRLVTCRPLPSREADLEATIRSSLGLGIVKSVPVRPASLPMWWLTAVNVRHSGWSETDSAGIGTRSGMTDEEQSPLSRSARRKRGQRAAWVASVEVDEQHCGRKFAWNLPFMGQCPSRFSSRKLIILRRTSVAPNLPPEEAMKYCSRKGCETPAIWLSSKTPFRANVEGQPDRCRLPRIRISWAPARPSASRSVMAMEKGSWPLEHPADQMRTFSPDRARSMRLVAIPESVLEMVTLSEEGGYVGGQCRDHVASLTATGIGVN